MPVEFIHRFLPGKSPVTLLTLHGTGGDENDLLQVGQVLVPGAAILSPRGKAVENGAFRFFSQITPGVFDENEIRTRAGELAEWIASAVAQYGLDPSRLYALSYSNGANMAAATMLLHPGSIAGGVLLRPMNVIRPATLPDLSGAPVLIVAGQEDALTPLSRTEALGRLLAEAGAAVDFSVQNTGHELTPQDFGLGKKWFAEVVSV
jgi:predicted esterase